MVHPQVMKAVVSLTDEPPHEMVPCGVEMNALFICLGEEAMSCFFAVAKYMDGDNTCESLVAGDLCDEMAACGEKVPACPKEVTAVEVCAGDNTPGDICPDLCAPAVGVLNFN